MRLLPSAWASSSSASSRGWSTPLSDRKPVVRRRMSLTVVTRYFRNAVRQRRIPAARGPAGAVRPWHRGGVHALLLLLVLPACGPDPGAVTARTPVTGTPGTDTGTDTDTDTDAGTDEEPSVAQLDPVPRLARLSLDLRGVRPSLEEIASVEADESMLETYAERWVQQDPFLDRVGWMWNDALHTAVWGARSTGSGRSPLMNGV